ncbi:MAG: LysR family transcriptional regulator [Candidatus Latescibacterota bacterium]
MNSINMKHLLYFHAVARNRSITGASRELMISQSSLSIQIKQFENSLGHQLFNRRKTGVELTESGEIVYQCAERVYQEMENLKDLLEQTEHQVHGTIAIGTVNSIGIYMLPDLLKGFREAYPEVRIKIEFKSAIEVIDILQAGKVDVAIITWNRKYNDLTAVPLRRNKMFLVGPPDHPLAGIGNISPRELENYPFIGFEKGTPTRMMLDSLFKRMAIDVDYTMESGNVATIKHMVLAGMGLAFLPEVAVGQEIRDERLCRLEIPTMVMSQEITLYHKKSRSLSATKKEFIQFLQKYCTSSNVRKR